MTNKEAKEKLYMEWQKFLENNIDYAGISEAYKMAFKALDQEPTDDATLKDIFCMGCEYKEQEPIDYKAQYESFAKKAEIVISQLRADRDRLADVFDKIRAEIKALDVEPDGIHFCSANRHSCISEVLAIIDKYKAESEE